MSRSKVTPVFSLSSPPQPEESEKKVETIKATWQSTRVIEDSSGHLAHQVNLRDSVEEIFSAKNQVLKRVDSKIEKKEEKETEHENRDVTKSLKKILSIKCCFSLSIVLLSLLSTLTIFAITLTVQQQSIEEFTKVMGSNLKFSASEFITNFMAAPFRITESVGRSLYNVEIVPFEYGSIYAAMYPQFVVNNVSYISYTRKDDVYIGVYWSANGIPTIDFYREGCWVNTTHEVPDSIDARDTVVADPVTHCRNYYTGHMDDLYWWVQGNMLNSVTWGDTYCDKDGFYWVSSYFPIHNASNIVYNKYSKTVGPELNVLISVDMDLSSVSIFLNQNLQISKNSFIYVVQSNDMVMVATSRLEDTIFVFDLEMEGFIQKKRLNESSIPTVAQIGAQLIEKYGLNLVNVSIPLTKFFVHGYEYRLEVVDISDKYGLDWKCMIFIAVDDYMGNVYTLRDVVLIVDSLIVIISLIVGIVISYFVTSPLTQLGKKMEELQRIQIDTADLISEVTSRTSGLDTNEDDEDLEKAIETQGRNSIFYEVFVLQDHFSRMSSAIQNFMRYVPVEIVNTFMKGDQSSFELGVQSKRVAVFFSDIKGFTTISEQLEPGVLIKMLNIYFEKTCTIIYKNKGVLDKFIGDALMVLFNAPETIEKYEYLAVKSALDIQKMLNLLNQRFLKRNLPQLYTRIGISVGDSLVGNIGSSFRTSYTCIGDNVNLAARLEGINKLYSTNILISDTCYEKVHTLVVCRLVDCVAVKGKAIGRRIYTVLGQRLETGDEVQKMCDRYASILENHYWKRDFVTAKKELEQFLEEFPDDGPCQEMLDRCNAYMKGSLPMPPMDWTGVYMATEK